MKIVKPVLGAVVVQRVKNKIDYVYGTMPAGLRAWSPTSLGAASLFGFMGDADFIPIQNTLDLVSFVGLVMGKNLSDLPQLLHELIRKLDFRFF